MRHRAKIRHRQQSSSPNVFVGASPLSPAVPPRSQPGPDQSFATSPISSAVVANIERLQTKGRLADVEWWQAQLDWVEQNGAMLAATGV